MTTTFIVVHGAIPSELTNGHLYVNPSMNRAHHLCACGCGSRILTPLNKDEWKLSGSDTYPTLFPSIGNWNLACQSHYWIRKGMVIWAPKWTPEQIEVGRAKEQRPYLKITIRDRINQWIKLASEFFFKSGK